MVLQVLAARDQPLTVERGEEEAAALGVGEAREDLIGERSRPAEEALLKRRLIEREQRLEQESVVFEVGGQARRAVVVGPQQAPVAVAHLLPDELSGAERRLQGGRIAEHGAGGGQRGDDQRVPGTQALVIERSLES